MRRSQLRLAILMVIGTLLLGACNSFKLFHSTNDKTITTNIQAKLFSNPVLKTRDIRVDSQNGIVTLSGTVGTDLERSAAERIATQEDGVKSVVNILNAAPPSAATEPAAPVSEGIQSTETAPPPQQVAPPAEPPAPPERPAAKTKRHAQPAHAVSKEDKATAELHAYTNSIPPEAGANPSPAPAPAPAPTPMAAGPAAPAPAPPPAPAPKPQEHLTIPAGTVATIRMIDSIDSSRNRPGEEFTATLDSPIVVGDRVVASRGADARVRLVEAKSAGRMTGQSELQLELVSMTLNGVSYPTHSGYYEQHGGSRGTRTAETVGGGAVLGALIGGLLGHGKGAAIGSVAGAGAGTATQASTKGQQVKVPTETKLDFTLKDPVSVAMGGS
ncbi:MAG: BON domain-containing protein [Acidobacteriota bacterium]|nr:BON domain-containing protein [Acidobacteriota bacterium]